MITSLRNLDNIVRYKLSTQRAAFIKLSKRKRYDQRDLKSREEIVGWNDGSALDENSEKAQKYLKVMRMRAHKGIQGSEVSVRDFHKQAVTDQRVNMLNYKGFTLHTYH